MTVTANDRLLDEIVQATAAPAPALMTAQQAATFLGVTDVTLRRWRAKGVGPQALKAGAHYRYSRTALLDFLTRDE